MNTNKYESTLVATKTEIEAIHAQLALETSLLLGLEPQKLVSTPRLYVGTYAKYNNGSIQGAWLDLDDYVDSEDFYTACKELHSDEVDPEFMFQDFEGFPKSLYSESGNVDEIYEYIDFIINSHMEQDAVDAGLSLDIPLDKLEDAYSGWYENDKDFAYQLATDCGFEESNVWPQSCIDWEQASREIMLDYDEAGGHYFSNNW
jgi:antirestriction protein